MRVLYVGNFQPTHSTERHLERAFVANGINVFGMQESPTVWDDIDYFVDSEECDFVAWTHTHGLAPEESHDRQWAWLTRMRRKGIPTVGVHLDRWWGLARQHQAETEPFFRCDLLCTADGAHDDEWARVGVEHHWMLPAVLASECELSESDPRFVSDLAFVGSWHGGYHPEHPWRQALVAWLRRHYGARCALFPRKGHPAIRGEELRALYASVKVLVGDSCLAPTVTGEAMRAYCSDRLPESLGRGGFLVHPHVDGVTDGTHYTAGVHLDVFPMGDFDALRDVIDRALDDPDHRAKVSQVGRAHVLEHHTYERRVEQLLETMKNRGLL